MEVLAVYFAGSLKKPVDDQSSSLKTIVFLQCLFSVVY